MAKIFLSLGTNLGNREQALKSARVYLSQQLKNIKTSSIYQTRPWGKKDQPNFLNFCISAETNLSPQGLLAFIKHTEKELGRKKREKWGPREIDIDILFYDDQIIDLPGLKIPHPHLHQRSFVLIPLTEIAPKLKHPVLNKAVRELAQKIDKSGVKKQIQLMAILNATPDSFSDGGDLDNKNTLAKRVKEVIEQGADIIDVGGESTRPGHKPVDQKEEIKRILPVIKAIRAQSKTIPISVDTQKAAVAYAALNTGATMINDISALSDPKMAAVAVEFDYPVVLMRNKGIQKDVIPETKKQFEQIIDKALLSGIKKENIILDPGLGFGDLKTQNFSAFPGSNVEANLSLVKQISDYSLGYPVLIGGSRKRFIGKIMKEPTPKKRVKGSVEIAVMAAKAGASIIRVHDVKETVKALNQTNGSPAY